VKFASLLLLFRSKSAANKADIFILD